MTPQNPVAKPHIITPENNTLSSIILSPSFAATWLFVILGTIDASSHFLAPPIDFGMTPEISLNDNLIASRLCKFPKHADKLPDKWFLERSIYSKDVISHNESGTQVLFAFEPIVEADLQYHKISIRAFVVETEAPNPISL
ncbi:hypothetical protein ACJIZ3_010632 [Penstemon smallii]|uniref:Uncharacterized protein n=1 Tax=Penstemon smallii TaxID=265156 RepID=A0ABD3UH49_9LAMI